VTRVTSQPPWRGSLFHVIIRGLCVRPNSQTLKYHSPVISPDPLNARSLRSLGFPKCPSLKKILDPPMPRGAGTIF